MSVHVALGAIMGQESAAWTPASLSPEGWWRADLGHAYADTDPVGLWANQGTAGSAGDLQQGTAGNKPFYDASHASFNGQAVITFDGGDVLYATAGTWWHSADSAADLSVVGVFRTTLGASTAQDVVRTRTYGTTGGFDLIMREGAACRFELDETGGAVNLTDSGANGTGSAVVVQAGTFAGETTPSTDTATCVVDGTVGTGTTGDLLTIASSSNREFLVGGSATTTGTLTGSIAEVIFIKRIISGAEDALLTAYINSRYGLALARVTQ